jgi:aspartyl aminopeptidase
MAAKRHAKKTVKAKEKLVLELARVWDKLSGRERKEALRYAEGYRQFLNRARTERRAAADFVGQAKSRKFVELTTKRTRGNKVYQLLRSKLLFMAVVGRKPLTEGIRLITSHIDCPRLDLKPNPLYEDTDLALFKTHYYGGIKKYQWVSRTLAMVGTVILSDGTSLDVEIGLDPEEPVLTIPDLLPHLGKKQMEKSANEFIPAENLNVMAGGLPHADKEAEERVKQAVLELLNAKYGMSEEDFTSAEIQLVPAEPARDAGLDRSFIAGYGQDDRVCAYTSFTALLETERPEHTAVAVFYDKEEIGSEGNTGAQSRFLEMFLMDLMEKSGTKPTAQNLNRLFLNGRALSADVNAAFDPTYSDVFEKRNACKAGFGVAVEKHSGHGGKYMASESSAEYTAWIRNLLNRSGIVWQMGGHGKVDEGGGGTVAKFLARTGMDIIDIGPPILGMHSPLEVVSKEDVWMCHKAFSAFFKS